MCQQIHVSIATFDFEQYADAMPRKPRKRKATSASGTTAKRGRRHTRPKESSTRKKIDSILLNLGWVIDEESVDCNVFTERAKTIEQNRKLKGKEPDYVLYESGTDRPIAIIETKRPGKTLNAAIQKATTEYAKPLGINIVFACDGGIVESFDRRSSGPLLQDDEPVTDLLPESILKRFHEEGPSLYTPTKTQQTKQELIRIFKQANDLLRKEGLREGIERFTEFSNLLFLKLISEIETDRESRGLKRRLEKRYCWDAFAKKPAEDMLDYLNDTVLPRLVDSYNHSGEVFQSRLQIANAATLKEIVDRLSELSLLDAESDVKGDAFEYFLKHSVTVGNDLGEYFTPRHIVRLIVELVDPRYKDTVYDPCCGTGGFLIEAFRHIAQKVKQTPSTRRVLEEETIWGREITGTSRIAKMNMILAGDGHTNIHQMDTLKSPVKEQFNIVLTNFPFSQDTDYAHLYGLDTEDANPVFLKHVIDSCAKDGRIGVVVPEGLLFDEKAQYVLVRRMLTEACNIEAIVALHDFVFRPYTGQPTSILILNKGTPTKDVWFYSVDEDGFEKTSSKKGRPPRTGPNHLVELRSIWSEKPETDRSFTVDISRIRENSYKLSMSSYRERADRPDWVPLGGPDGVCEIKIGGTPRTEIRSYYGGPHPWVTISDMKDRHVVHTEKTLTDSGVANSSVKLLPKGTVLLSFKLSIGKVAISGRDLYTNEAIAGLVPKDGRVLPEYLYHILPAIDLRAYMQPAAKGKTLNKGILESIRVPIPSTTEQRKFIAKMNRFEAKTIRFRENARDIEKEAADFAQLRLSHSA